MIRAVLLASVVGLAGVSCASTEGSEDRVTIVASFYPLAEAAERLAGDLAVVENLTPPGVEPHDLELAPDDLEAIVRADVVVYVGGGFQPAVEEAVSQAEGTVVDALEAAGALLPPEVDDDLAADPHVWLDPARYAAIVDALADDIALAVGEAEQVRANAAAFRAELEALDRQIADGLATCDSRLMVVNHAAFGYLAYAYDLEQVAISGVSPEAEPDPARLAELRALVRDEGVTTVFTEELAAPQVAEALADEAGVGTAMLSPLEGLTADEPDAGEDYGSVMRRNLETLRSALGCV